MASFEYSAGGDQALFSFRLENLSRWRLFGAWTPGWVITMTLPKAFFPIILSWTLIPQVAHKPTIIANWIKNKVYLYF